MSLGAVLFGFVLEKIIAGSNLDLFVVTEWVRRPRSIVFHLLNQTNILHQGFIILM